jgi:hypothetical protein
MSEVIDTTNRATEASVDEETTLASENQEQEEAAALAGEIDFSMMANINAEFVQALIESV